MIYQRYIKPLIDRVGALTILMVASPLLVICAALIGLTTGRPILLIQQRGGYRNTTFNMIKFRTMTNQTNNKGQLLPDWRRLTRTGRLIRLLSLDELPQLINVLNGDMSIIGPRPFLSEYLPLYSEHQKKRHQVKPGITGLAQVKGRNLLGWNERIELDIVYVNTCSWCLDVYIILMTIFRIIYPHGVNQSVNDTMTKFTGSFDD